MCIFLFNDKDIELYNSMTEELLLETIKAGRLECAQLNLIKNDLKLLFENL